MANNRTTENDADDKGATEKSDAERMFPDPRDLLGLMVSCQRLGQQIMWQMGETMGDVMSMPLKRDGSEKKKENPFNRAMAEAKDAIDGATEILQQGGKPR